MGMFDSLQKEAMNALGSQTPMIGNMIKGLIDQHGGMEGLMKSFHEKGLGEIAKSWMGSGENMPIAASALEGVLGNEHVTNLAQKFGISKETLMEQVAQHLPGVMNQMAQSGSSAGSGASSSNEAFN